MAEQKVSLRPDSFAEGGGLLDDFDGKIGDIRFITTDYDGHIPTPVTVARIVYEVDGEEVGTDLLSVGGKDDFVPNEVGTGLTALKSKYSLTKKSKFGMFMNALVLAGFPLPKMDDGDISYLNGLEGHFLRKVVEYKGLTKKSDTESTVMVCTNIINLPWEGNVKKGKAKGKAKVDDGLADVVAGIILGVVIGSDGEITKAAMLSALFKSAEIKAWDDKDKKKAALKLATDDTYLAGRDEWVLADGVLKMR